MSVMVDLRIAELLSSRLCHELINPVGAVNNGIELMSDLDDTADPEAMTLVAQSAKSAAARLHFYRLAYGQALGVGTDLTLGEALAIAGAVIETNRVRLAGKAMGSGVDADTAYRLARPVLKLLLKILVLGAEALPRGGQLAVGLAAQGAGMALKVQAEGDQAGLTPETQAALAGRIDPGTLTARTVHAYFTGRLSEDLSLSIETAQSQGSYSFTVKLPATP